MIKNQRGQAIVIAPFIIIGLIAIFSLVVDGIIYYLHWQGSQVDLDAACTTGAAGFYNSLESNGHTSDGGTIQYGSSNTMLTTLDEPHMFYLAQFMGIKTMDIHVESRCTVRRAALLPIAVKEPWVLEGLSDPNKEFPILGQGAECDECQGSDFSGAVIPQIICSNTDCDPRTYFEPTTDSNSPNVFKDVVQGSIAGSIYTPLPGIGTRVPEISGVSNHFLVQTVVDAGYAPGDQLIVIVYNGTIDVPAPSYGTWENLEIIYYALVTISKIDSNTMWVTFDEKLENSSSVFNYTVPRTVPWDWGGWVE